MYKKKDSDDAVMDYDSSWQPVDGLDDAVEKHFGKQGTIMIALHSDDFSNESIATDAELFGRSAAAAWFADIGGIR